MLLKLVNIIDETPEVKSFFWETSEKVKWVSGQYFYYTLPKLKFDDPRGNTRHFTISSSTSEGSLLRLTTKFPNPMSGYKKTLLELKIGDEIEGRGPSGSFTLGPTSLGQRVPKNMLFFAGGIGTTPFRSMIKYNFDNKFELPYLIYSNSDSNFVFGDELNEILGNRLVLHDSSKNGHIDELKIGKFIGNWKLEIGNLDFYVVGPPPFVNAIEDSLEKLEIESDKIQSEKFTGY